MTNRIEVDNLLLVDTASGLEYAVAVLRSGVYENLDKPCIVERIKEHQPDGSVKYSLRVRSAD